MSDRRAVIRSHLEKVNEAALSFTQEETKVMQLNAYPTAAGAGATDKLETATENNKAAVKELDDNVSSTDATVALPTTRAAEDEVFVKEERPADFKDKVPLASEHDASVDKTQEEELEQSTAAVEEEDGIPEGEAGEREKQVLPTAQCDLRPTKSDPRQKEETQTNGGSAESTNQATPRRKRARRDPNDHSRRRSRCANTEILRARHAEDGMVRKRVRPTSDALIIITITLRYHKKYSKKQQIGTNKKPKTETPKKKKTSTHNNKIRDNVRDFASKGRKVTDTPPPADMKIPQDQHPVQTHLGSCNELKKC
ncbi:hypothetical protein FQA39_LY00282 [Lamprigera yunnana]|nr:hypothetical protein FQA39_LY00282 [Lamprigera yunnana]